MKMLLEAGLLHGGCLTVTGKTIAENLKEFPALKLHQEVVMDLKNPLKPSGPLVVMKGNLAPEGALAKVSGLKSPVITGPAKVYDSEEDALKAILGNEIMEGD